MASPAPVLSERHQQIAALKQDYEMTFTTEHGARVLKHLESISFVRESTIPMGVSMIDPLMMAAREGMRRMVCIIHDQLTLPLAALVNRPTTAILEEGE